MAPTSTSISKKRKADNVSSSSSPSKQSSPKKSRKTSISVEVSPNNPEYDPVVVSFPRGVPSSIIDNNNNKSNNATIDDSPLRFTCSKLKASSSRGRRITGEDDNCTYTASAVGHGHDGRLTKMYVCVYNKKKKTLKLVPSAEKGTVFALEQAVKEYTPNVANESMLFGSGTTQDDGEGNAKVMSASDRVQLLVESFGSKKKQKVMASRAANKVNIHSLVGAGDVMMKSVTKQEGISAGNKKGMEEGSTMVNPNDVAFEQARKKMLPPYDINADAPSKVYNAQSIAGTIAWDKVSRIVETVFKKKNEGTESDWIGALLGKKKGFRPPSIVALLESIDPAKKGSSYRIKAAFFLFLAYKFHGKLQRRGMIEGASLDDCVSALYVPHEVGLRLFELFTSQMDGNEGGYIASKQQKSKLTAYILILYMIASGKDMKVTSINQLCKDMKLDGKEATLVLRESGFVVKKNGAGNMGVSLSVPLKFPPPKRGKRT
ncbi:hypothetical protein ACHAXR_003810 [Thalassiosira sp. AJA248-18]